MTLNPNPLARRLSDTLNRNPRSRGDYCSVIIDGTVRLMTKTEFMKDIDDTFATADGHGKIRAPHYQINNTRLCYQLLDLSIYRSTEQYRRIISPVNGITMGFSLTCKDILDHFKDEPDKYILFTIYRFQLKGPLEDVVIIPIAVSEWLRHKLNLPAFVSHDDSPFACLVTM